MTVLLQRLTTGHVPLARVLPGPRARDGVVVFADGTQLLLVTRRGNAGMKPLMELSEPRRGFGARVRLVRVQPSFAGCSFRLWFASAGAPVPAELLAKVGPAPE
jgi:hypothetical protein